MSCNLFIDSIFAPNQTVNLSELESEERDIESFKRFNYYFKPPVHKPKVNFDVKNIVLAKKGPCSSDSSSPYCSETASNNGTPSSLDDLLYNDLTSLKISSSPATMIVDTSMGQQQQLIHQHQYAQQINNNDFSGNNLIDKNGASLTSLMLGGDSLLHEFIDNSESGLVD